MTDLPAALTACLALGGFAAVAQAPLLWRSRRRLTRARSERDAAAAEAERLTARLRELTEETHHLAAARLPALVNRLRHDHVPVPGLAHPHLLGSETDRDHRAVLDLVSRAVLGERERVDEAAQAVLRGATRAMQARSYRLQDRLNAMQHRYEDPGVIRDTVELSRLNEQILRRVQATGVVCGATAGLTRADSHLGDVVVGAQSRIAGAERVRITSRLTEPVGVVARAVEPAAIVLAELLANAVHHSHGTLEVDVSLHLSDTGAVVVIDDAGVGMHPEEVAYATRMVSGRHPLLLTGLGDPPRLGFAVIGRLVRQFGFAVSVDKPAPYGGVRAVVHIPRRLLTLLDETTTPMSVAAPLPGRSGAGHGRPQEPAAPRPGAAWPAAPEPVPGPRTPAGPGGRSGPPPAPRTPTPRPVPGCRWARRPPPGCHAAGAGPGHRTGPRTPPAARPPPAPRRRPVPCGARSSAAPPPDGPPAPPAPGRRARGCGRTPGSRTPGPRAGRTATGRTAAATGRTAVPAPARPPTPGRTARTGRPNGTRRTTCTGRTTRTA
ncbi:sensor histidine kinase [Streptomyces pactum]|uniref:histidine kinase n=1 Tax=Streptomyces pactum TaxID=68249 RepID=A0ABS0NPH0_9ACTN|nr:sensor histidine kinase [Streptomyces pactum]MBH5337104.1 sensor histidine kinase [Streptomyces pactum]